jgi:amidase
VSDPTSLSLTNLMTALNDGACSVEEVMVSFLDRIDRINPKINALVSLRSRDALIAEARAKDAERRDGTARGALHGVPVAIKDLSEAKGILCTYGSPLFHDYVPDFDDIQVERIRAAGAIIIGKTNTPE